MAKAKSKPSHKGFGGDELFLAAAAVFFSAVAVILILSKVVISKPAMAQEGPQQWLEELNVLGTSTSDSDFEQLDLEASQL